MCRTGRATRGFLGGRPTSLEKLAEKLLNEKICLKNEMLERKHPGTITFPPECKKEILTVFFTSYNPDSKQTDSTPCVAGGTGFNLCDMAKEGNRTIALSQELIKWAAGKNAPFGKGDLVWLESTTIPNDPRCNGTFIVADGMNARFAKRGDIFVLNEKDNLSCKAKIYKITSS